MLDNLINHSEVARRIKMSPMLFRKKLKKENYNKFSQSEIDKINETIKNINFFYYEI